MERWLCCLYKANLKRILKGNIIRPFNIIGLPVEETQKTKTMEWWYSYMLFSVIHTNTHNRQHVRVDKKCFYYIHLMAHYIVILIII